MISNMVRTLSQTVNLKSDIFSQTQFPATTRSSQVTQVESGSGSSYFLLPVFRYP